MEENKRGIKISFFKIFKGFSISIFIISSLLIGLAYICTYQDRDIESTYYQKHLKYDESLSDKISIKSNENSFIGGPYTGLRNMNNKIVKRGSDVIFLVQYTGNIANCNLTYGSIALNGFVGTKILNQIDETTVKITIRDIDTNNFSTPKSIAITGGTAISPNGDLSNSVKSSEFDIRQSGFQKLMNFIANKDSVIVEIIVGILSLFGILYKK